MSIRLVIPPLHDLATVVAGQQPPDGDPAPARVRLTPRGLTGAVLVAGQPRVVAAEAHVIPAEGLVVTLADPSAATPSGWQWHVLIDPERGQRAVGVIDPEVTPGTLDGGDRVYQLAEVLAVSVAKAGVPVLVAKGDPGDKGDKGDPGDKGDKGDKGDSGAAGPANSLAIGTVTTGAAGSSASASITGTAPAQTLDLTIPRGSTGDPSAYELRGTGMPNGVITAPPGTYYTDTAGTNGAWRWLKKTGAGNTGWGCIVGDTGWRLLDTSGITSWSSTEPGQKLGVRRVNDTVYIQYQFIGGSLSYGEWSLPVGFRAANIFPRRRFPILRELDAQSSPIASGVLLMGGLSSYFSAITAGFHYSGGFELVADDAWPTTLPGTPA